VEKQKIGSRGGGRDRDERREEGKKEEGLALKDSMHSAP